MSHAKVRKVPLQTSLAPNEMKKFEAAAKERQLSLAEYARELIRQALDREQQRETRDFSY